MLRATKRIDGRITWANLHQLIWLTLIPFTTSWAGEKNFAPVTTAAYGFVLIVAALAYTLRQTAIARYNGTDP